MPTYGYQCKCGHKREELLPIKDLNKPQTCKCGEVMQRKMSACYFIIKPTGKQMALDTLNDRQNGMPYRHWRSAAERHAAGGLEN